MGQPKCLIVTGLLAALMAVSYATFDEKDCIIDAALVIDNSGSITNNKANMKNWDFVIQFAQDIAAGINIGPGKSQLGLVDFHTWATTHFTLSSYSEEADVVKAVGDLEHAAHTTNTPEGLQFGRELLLDTAQGSRPGVPKVMFVITDGEPSPDFAAGLDDEIAKTKAAGIRIIAVGVTDGVKVETLQQLASTENDYYIVDNFDKLDAIKRSILNEDTCKPPPPVVVPPVVVPPVVVPPVVVPPVAVDESLLLASCNSI